MKPIQRKAILALTFVLSASSASATLTDLQGEPLPETRRAAKNHDAEAPRSHLSLERFLVLDRAALFGLRTCGGAIYDANGNLTEERLPNGNVALHTYDGLNRRTGSQDALGVLSTTAYDARGNAFRSTDANGNETTRTFDALDRLIEERLPESRIFVHSYDAAGNRLSTTNARGNSTRFDYDALNRLVQTIDPAPFLYETSFSYDLAGNKLTETNRRGLTTSFDYDALNRLTKATDPPLTPSTAGFEQSFSYDAIGNRLRATDRKGIVTTLSYDRENRVLVTTRAGVAVATHQYDGNGNRIFVTDANLHITGFEYDERNLLKAENRPLAAITKFGLDDMGDRIRRLDAENRVTEWTYDLRRRQLRENRPLGSGSGDDEEEARCYDGNGNRIARFQPEAVAALGSSEPCISPFPGAFAFAFDAANRLSSVRDPLGNTTTYGYDPSSNRTAQGDANAHQTRFDYDPLERLTRKTYPEVAGAFAEESYGYDANGNRTRLVDAQGQSFSWTFDELDRETLASYPLPTPARGDDLLSIATTYDPNGNPLAITETFSGPSGARLTTQTWDAFDRQLTKSDPYGKKLIYGYDAAGNRTRLTDPDGKTTLYGFDDLNRMVTALPQGSAVTTYDYFKNGLLRKISYPNGATATHVYDPANRIQRIENKQYAGIVSSYDYNYDKNGNRIHQTEINGGAPEITSYGYDDADRLTQVNYPDKTVDYTLDGVGNRTNEVTTETATSTVASSKLFTYNERDWLTAIADSADPTNDATYSYDLNGNQVARTQGSAATGFIYDTRDQLVEVQNDGLLVESYGFSYDGLRTRKSGSGSLLRFVYDGRSLLLETDLAGNTISKYEWGSDRLLSLNHATEGRVHYLFDGLGSPVSLSKPDGSLQARVSWGAWGELRSSVGASSSLFGFTGYQRDVATGLLYAGARFYDPELGRFLNEDPIIGFANTPPSLHRYSYALGNPTLFVDPDGRCVLGLPCPEVLQREKEKLVEGTAILWDTAKGAAKDVAVATIGTLDLATAGSISASTAAVSGLVSSEGSLQERGQAAAEAGRRAQINTVTLGFSESKDKVQHAKDLVGISAIERAGTKYGEAIAEKDLERALDATGELLTGAGQIAGTVAIAAGPAAKAGIIPKPGFMAGAPTATSQVTRVEGTVLGESASTGGTAIAEVKVTQSVPASTTATTRTSTIAELRSAGLKDAHHVIQNAAVRELPGYESNLSRGVQLPGPSTARGAPHYEATQVQRQAGGGTYGAERRIGYKALREGGLSEAEARQAIAEADVYFESIGVMRTSPTRIPGDRR